MHLCEQSPPVGSVVRVPTVDTCGELLIVTTLSPGCILGLCGRFYNTRPRPVLGNSDFPVVVGEPGHQYF